MRIAVSTGHNVFNNGYFDNGSISPCGKYKEAAITRATVRILIPILQRQGHIVKDVTPYNQHFSSSKEAHKNRSNRVKEFNPDLYLDIHVNAGGGTGPEVLLNAKNPFSYKYGKAICKAISKDTGLRNRGVKHMPGYWSISMHKHPSIIVEGGFIDSPGGKDMKVLTPLKYAYAIASVFGEVNRMTEEQVRKIVQDEINRIFNREEIGDWAKAPIHFVKDNKIMEGYKDGTFKPNRPVTRAELATVMYRTKKD